MTAAREAVLLPCALLTVALLGGLDPGSPVTWKAPTLFSLVLAVMVLGALVRSGALAPERLVHQGRTTLARANGVVVLASLFAATAQVGNMLMPRSGLPEMVVGLVVFLLLVNTLVMSPDRVRLLRSLAVVTGSAFLLKFVILGALADPEGSRTKRVLLALFDAATLGTISQAPVSAAAGYLGFFMTLLYLIAVASLPQRSGRRVNGSPAHRIGSSGRRSIEASTGHIDDDS